MEFHLWLIFIAAGILPAISPGPAVLLAVSNSLRYGARSVYISGTGNALGIFVLGIGVFFGLGFLLQQSIWAFTVLKFIGAGYMIYLGVKTWRDRKGFDVVNVERPSSVKLFFTAFLLSVTNPKAILIIASLFPFFMDHDSTLAKGLIMSITYAVMCWLNHCFIGYMGETMKRFLNSSEKMAIFRKSLSAGFIAFGAVIAASSR